jgi:hypothetical protein
MSKPNPTNPSLVFKAPFYPIIYVRGFAMTTSERNETAADPFCGFNLGSTSFRASSDKKAPVRKFIFESPIVRLAKDFGYTDVYENGLNIDDDGWTARLAAKAIDDKDNPKAIDFGRSIVIYRYYDEGSTLFGDGTTKPIEAYANGLSDLILQLKRMICAALGTGFNSDEFRCYLVAHSMGGLVVRALLQNDQLGTAEAKRCVDKVFTYATPHNGIQIAGVAVPDWLGAMDLSNFSHKRMGEYLSLEATKMPSPRMDFLPEEKFRSDRFFCLVGTNRNDYDAGMGLSRTFAGSGSDGLVKIDNASVWGLDAKFAVTKPAPTAYVYKSHSGRFGIVNSEEGYQNLSRFLFGDMKAEIWLHITNVTVPNDKEGKPLDDNDDVIEALYQFELEAGPRGKRWQLTRRLAEEDSTACRTHDELTNPTLLGPKFVYLSTVFLSKRARVDPNRPSLAYSMSIACRVPEYRRNQKYWLDKYYEGMNLFDESYILEAWPPENSQSEWRFKYGIESTDGQEAKTDLQYKLVGNGEIELRIPFSSGRTPGISGDLIVMLSDWQ